MKSEANTTKEYMELMPAEKRAVIRKVRQIIRKHLPKGYEETMQYGMISYVVPLKLYPRGYLDKKDTPLPYIALAAQKNYFALYLMHIYANESLDRWFRREYMLSGKKLDMGKSCLRFKHFADLPIELIAEAVRMVPVAKHIKNYELAKFK
jgi:hypothetical protein